MCALVDDNDDHDEDDYDGAMILMVVMMILVTYEWPMSITLVHVCVLVDQICHRAVAGQVAHLSRKLRKPERKTYEF